MWNPKLDLAQLWHLSTNHDHLHCPSLTSSSSTLLPTTLTAATRRSRSDLAFGVDFSWSSSGDVSFSGFDGIGEKFGRFRCVVKALSKNFELTFGAAYRWTRYLNIVFHHLTVLVQRESTRSPSSPTSSSHCWHYDLHVRAIFWPPTFSHSLTSFLPPKIEFSCTELRIRHPRRN